MPALQPDATPAERPESAPALQADAAPAAQPEQPTPPLALELRIEPSGPAAERGVAALCAGGALARDHAALPGTPAAAGTSTSGPDAVALLVQAAALSLDDTDLRMTLQRR